MTRRTLNQFGFFGFSLLVTAFAAMPALAQTSADTHAQHQQTDQSDLQKQIQAMQEKLSQLEATLNQRHSAANSGAKENSDAMDMPGMKKMGMEGKGMKGMKTGMGMKSMGMKNMDKMPGMGMDKMSDMKGKKQNAENMGMEMMGNKMGKGMMSKGMQMMGKMKSMGDMEMPSSLPGFPGASHIYHIGADSFFLDHAEHITLTTEQQTTLNKIKEVAMLKQADFDRQIESDEQEVWVLTSSDSPDAKQIEEKISDIAKLQSEQRIDYIRAVGNAAEVLTEQQRQALTGVTEHDDHQPTEK